MMPVLPAATLVKVPTDSEPGPDLEQAGTGHGQPLVLRLTVCRTEPFAGVIAHMDGTAQRRFGGWIDLMRAIDALSAAARQAGGCT